MWKNHDDAVGAQPEFASQMPDLESVGAVLIESLKHNRDEKREFRSWSSEGSCRR